MMSWAGRVSRLLGAKLDAAVLAAYGWPAGIADDDLLAKLLELNLSRSGTTAATSDEDE
jgi:hypothetical protein